MCHSPLPARRHVHLAAGNLAPAPVAPRSLSQGRVHIARTSILEAGKAPNLPFEVPQRVRLCFNAIDVDKSGYLEDQEIVQALRRYGFDATSGTGRKMVQEAVGDDGKLDFDEFAMLVIRLEKERQLSRQLEFLQVSVTPRTRGSPRVWQPA